MADDIIEGFCLYHACDVCDDCGGRGKLPIGWYQGRPSVEGMRTLAIEEFRRMFGREPLEEEWHGENRRLDSGERYFRIWTEPGLVKCEYYFAEEFEMKKINTGEQDDGR